MHGMNAWPHNGKYKPPKTWKIHIIKMKMLASGTFWPLERQTENDFLKLHLLYQ
jgi:hypothetical protein